MPRHSILVIEDEDDIADLVCHHLAKDGREVFRAATGEDGLRLAKEKQPCLILLDLMLPGMDGLQVCQRLRAEPTTEKIAVIMLTAKGEETDRVVGLELGADDYIVKPFSPRELVSRVKAVMRRYASSQALPENAGEGIMSIGALEINIGKREVKVEGEPADLTFTEFGILRLLAGRPGWVFSRNQILDAVRGHDAISTDRAVDVQIVGLRKKLGAMGKAIETVRGVGYRFKEEA